MSADEELSALARAREASPGDAGLALRHARMLVRAGEVAPAQTVLVAMLDRSPGHVELTAELDHLTCGRQLGAPWPSPRGDPARSGRSRAPGPRRGIVARRTPLDVFNEIRSIAVEAPGRALVGARGALWSVDASGAVTPRAVLTNDFELQATVLLPRDRTLLIASAQALLFLKSKGPARVARSYKYSSSFAVGSSGALHCAVKAGRVDRLALAVPAEAETILRTEPDAAVALAIAPGGDLLVVVEGHARDSRPAVLSRLSSAGDVRWRRELVARSLGRLLTQPVIDSDGTTFVSFPGDELVAIDASGAVVWRVPDRGEPAGFAGEGRELLLLRDHGEHAFTLVDARTGAVRGRLQAGPKQTFGIPKIDARGWIYFRRGDDLVAWDPDAPATPAFELPGVSTRYWDFAFAGDEQIFAFGRVENQNELVVIE